MTTTCRKLSSGRQPSVLVLALHFAVGVILLSGNLARAATAPSVGSPVSSSVTGTTATLGGTVTSDGGAPITERGVVYSVTSTNNNPQINGSGVVKVLASGTTGAFTVPVAPLMGSTQYSFAAYARNSVGSSYTTPVSTFTTGVATSGSTGFGLPVETSPPSMATQWVICVSGSLPNLSAVAGTGMSDAPVLGEIRNVAFSPSLAGFSSQFLPCDGRLLSISSYSALFSILGTNYGGNGSSNFALPDLRGRLPVHFSATHTIGSVIGAETTTLGVANLPPHAHTVPGGANTGSTGSGSSFSIQQPALALNLRIVETAGTASVGWIRVFAFSAAAGLTACDGGAYNRSGGNWAALFAKIGTTYGAGNGSTTFNVPDLRGRAMIGSGTGSGLTSRTLGQSGGSSTATLSVATLPSHQHTLPVGSTNNTGSGGALAIMSPYLVLNPTIALAGNSASITENPVLGEVRFRADSGVPAGWSSCNGSILLVSGNSTLFSLLGDAFGGNGTTTFGLPDIRGRSVTSADNGAGVPSGITSRDRGDFWGAETTVLTTSQLPAHTHTFTSYDVSSPEITVTGNGNSITSGDATPSLADHTDFGTVAANGGSTTRTFTILNAGGGSLALTGSPLVVIGGTHAEDFTITSEPADTIAPVNGTTTFQVTFDPTAAGLRSATLSIASNDSNENPFTFAIQGMSDATLVETGSPGIAIQWVICISGNFPPNTAAGSGMGDEPVLGEIRNVAFDPALSGFSSQFLPCDGRLLPISSNSSLFSLLGTTYGGDGSITFALPDLRGRAPVHFSASLPLGSVIGGESTTLVVANLPSHSHTAPGATTTGNTGNGTAFSIQQPALALNCRIMDNVPSTSSGWIRIFAFPGAAGLTPCDGSAYVRSGGNWATLFLKIGTTFGAGNGSTTFNVPDLRSRTMLGSGTGNGLSARTLGQTGGSSTVALTLATMPPHEHVLPVGTSGSTGGGESFGKMSPFLVLNPLIAIAGNSATINANPVQGEIRFRADSAVPSGWTACTGSLLSTTSYPTLFSLLGTTYGSNRDISFGVPDLRGRSVTSADNGQGSLPPGIRSRNRGDRWGTESLTLDAGQMPAHTHSYSVSSVREIAVEGNGQNIVDGTTTVALANHTDFGSVPVAGGTVTRTFTVRNLGGTALNLNGTPKVAVSGNGAFTVQAQPTSPVAAIGGTTTFQVVFDPASVGILSATLSIANDDADENPFSFTVGGQGSNSNPTDITLDSSIIDENNLPNATIGSLSTTDADAGQSFTYTLVAGSGDADNASFTLSGNTLRLTPSADFETKSSYNVRVQTSDGFATFAKAMTIAVRNVNEAPSFATGSSRNHPLSFTSAQSITTWATGINDGDATVAQSLGFTVTNDNHALFSVQPALSSNGTLTYTTNGSAGLAMVSVTLTDDATINGSPAITTPVQTFTISVGNGHGLAITSIQTLPGGNVRIDFTAVPGRTYKIDYGDSLTSWQTAVPAFVAGGTLLQWTDTGPPATESHPSTVPRRFYRVGDTTPLSP